MPSGGGSMRPEGLSGTSKHVRSPLSYQAIYAAAAVEGWRPAGPGPRTHHPGPSQLPPPSQQQEQQQEQEQQLNADSACAA